MKLSQIRQILSEYENTWYLHKFISGDHVEANQVRNYLAEFEDKSDDYELTDFNIYQLIKCLPLDSNLKLITDIINLIKRNFIPINTAELSKSNELFYRLLYNHIEYFPLYKALNYLSKHSLVDELLFDLCIIEAELNDVDIYSRNVFSLFKLFDANNFIPFKNRLSPLFTLSVQNVDRLYNVTFNLQKNNLLNHESFETAYTRITETLPKVTESTAHKNSRKSSHLPRSEIILDNNIRFFTGNKKQSQSGGYGQVKKGFISPDSDQPSFGIKKLFDYNISEAVHEVKYHRFLGRNAFYYSNNSSLYIVFDWLLEKDLDSYNSKELLAAPFEKRLHCLHSGLSDLNKFHLHFRVHSDIKPQNFILNLNDTSMKLIDFGFVRKYDSLKKYVCTPHYEDPYDTNHFHKDLYSMGIVTMALFPEIYKISFVKDRLIIALNKSSFSIHEKAVITLINSMMHHKANMRCTSADALNYCGELISNFDNLNELILKNITKSSINRIQITVEDVLRYTRC